MQLPFSKYHGAGNDFVIVDNRTPGLRLSQEQIAGLCDRHFGIGADGLMLLEAASDADFAMTYYNADGRESTLCGNGGRCIAAFAKSLGVIAGESTIFRAIDGLHKANFLPDGRIRLHMNDVPAICFKQDHAILNTGSPHVVKWVKDAASVGVVTEGRSIRHKPEFGPEGINVNFAQVMPGGGLYVRTYERGVEDETLSCGTGVTAAAIAAACSLTGHFSTIVKTPGGLLEVAFEKKTTDTAQGITLTGPAAFVFEGLVSIP